MKNLFNRKNQSKKKKRQKNDRTRQVMANEEDYSFNRRQFLNTAFFKPISIVAAGSVLGQLACGDESFNDRDDIPNLLFITADDLGWKALSCYGNKDIHTPNLDRLAREGVLFENAFVVSSSCAPSRASLVTGQYPHTHGVTGLTHIYKTRSLSVYHETLPDHLTDNGYNTALQGKWHVSPYLPASWYGYNERLSGIFPEDFKIHTAKKTIEFIEKNKDHRFYLEVNYMQNHRDAYGEFKMDADFPVDPEKISIPEYWTLPDSPGLREDAARYYSQTLKMDAMIGELLDTLDRLDIADKTMVVFTSDNGPPYPGNKMTLYDRGVGVPLLVRHKNKLPAGRRIKHLINSIDIMPTMLDAVKIPVPDYVQGISFYDMMLSEKPEPIREAVFLEMTNHVHYIPLRAVRTHRMKYIKNYSDITFGLDQNNHDEWAHELAELPNQPWKRPRVPEELYDLKNDPNEQVNLITTENETLKKKYQKIHESMKTLLRAHMKATADPYLDHEFTHDYNKDDYLPSVPGEKYK